MVLSTLLDVHDHIQARSFLEKKVYFIPGEDISPSKLAHIILQTMVSVPNISRIVLDTLHAISFLLSNLNLSTMAAFLSHTIDQSVNQSTASRLSPLISKLDDTFTLLNLIVPDIQRLPHSWPHWKFRCFN